METTVGIGLPDVVYQKYSGWNYPSWFFSTARYITGGPAWYGDEIVRLPALYYLNGALIIIFLVLAILVLMFFVTVPVVKYRTYSTITAIHALGMGLTISLCMVLPDWIVGQGIFESGLHDFSPAPTYLMRTGIHIGLTGFNVTLQHLSTPDLNRSTHPNNDFWYNEHVNTYHPEYLEREMNHFIKKGMSTPLLSIMSFMTGSNIGFEWPHRLSEAGFHCYIIMLAALIGWFYALLMIAFIPRFSSFAFVGVGYLMVINSLVYFYWTSIELAYPVITVNDVFIKLSYGPCFWSCLGIGTWSMIYGWLLAVIDIIHPGKFVTIFDVEYDEKRTLARAYQLNQFEERKSLKYRNPHSIRCAFPNMDNL